MAFVNSKRIKNTKTIKSGSCSVPGCNETDRTSFMAATNNLRYCEHHHEEVQTAYLEYKNINSINSGNKTAMLREARLRKEYGEKYTKGMDSGHYHFIDMLLAEANKMP